MAANTLQFKKLGFHFMPTSDLLIARLRNKIQPSATDDSSTNHNVFPIIDTDLYSAEPWNVLKEDDPWEISNSGEKSSCTRTIYVFTNLKFVGANNKRAARTAGMGTWSGSTGEKNVDGERPGSIIGTRSYFEFKIHKDEVGKIIVPGHWSMHEYKLGGDSYEGLDSIPLAKNLALCQITQAVEKSEGIHLSWPKTPFKLCFDKFKELGCFLKKRKQPEPADREHQQQVGDQEVQKRNKKRKRERPTSSAPRTLITNQPDFAMELEEILLKDRDDDDHRAQENRMDHEGGFNDQSSWAVDQNPNNFCDRDSEFAQQWQPELAKNSEKENYQNNLMSPANTPSCSYNYGADDGNSFFGQVGGSFSNALLRPIYNQMTASENEYLRMENQLRTDIKAPQPQLDPFELANSEEENYQNNSDQSVVLKGTVQIMSRADTSSCTKKYAADDQVGGWLSNSNGQMMVSENEKQGMENQPQLDRNPFSGVDLDELYERVNAPEWDLMIEQMMSSGESPSVFNSGGDGYSYYNEGAGKEKVAEVENGPNSNNKLGEVREEVNDDEYKFDVEEIGGSFDDLLEDADQLWGKGWSLEFQQDHSLLPLS